MSGTNKIAFILCTNDRDRKEECISYLRRLHIPDGMKTEIIPVTGKKGLCAAYQEAMDSSDARYKVYLHQDTLILARDFLSEMLACFARHPKAGMIGVIGRKDFQNRERFYQNEPFGALYETRITETVLYDHYAKKADEPVLYLDGLLMMTRVDLPWRTDLFHGWHLYDVSQSLEMIRAGYEIYVPYMEKPLVLHDCGLLSTDDYAKERDLAAAEYREFIP